MNRFIMNFPTLVGMNVDDAIEGLKYLLPGFEIVKVPIRTSVIQDIRLRRIRVYYDPNTFKVVYPPESG